MGDAVRGRKFVIILSRSVALLAILSAAASQVAAADQRLRPENACAAYDLHILTLIEDHGRAQEIGPKKLYEAMTTVLHARTACRTGDYAQAHRLYSRLDLRLTSVAPNDWVVQR